MTDLVEANARPEESVRWWKPEDEQTRGLEFDDDTLSIEVAERERYATDRVRT